MQEEFDKLMLELNEKRNQRDGESFYKSMHDYYYNDEIISSHDSPTKRLIQHKNTTFDHKSTMKDQIDSSNKYALVYTSPEKSYVIQPHEGELNYTLAEKNPLKFYDQVFTQDITKHTVGT